MLRASCLTLVIKNFRCENRGKWKGWQPPKVKPRTPLAWAAIKMLWAFWVRKTTQHAWSIEENFLTTVECWRWRGSDIVPRPTKFHTLAVSLTYFIIVSRLYTTKYPLHLTNSDLLCQRPGMSSYLLVLLISPHKSTLSPLILSPSHPLPPAPDPLTPSPSHPLTYGELVCCCCLQDVVVVHLTCWTSNC